MNKFIMEITTPEGNVYDYLFGTDIDALWNYFHSLKDIPRLSIGVIYDLH